MQIAKWGNSLAIRLPKALVDALGLKPGDQVELVAQSPRRLALAKADKRADFLAAMATPPLTLPAGARASRDEANER